jgi:NAD(P)-dependent dehydrogenase (short-subunit alcohol dehydrogenase family)
LLAIRQPGAHRRQQRCAVRSHIAVNLKGTFNTLREAARLLRDGGRIVNLSSSVTGLLQPTYGVYAAIKVAVEAMTSILAKELRGRNITVNAIAPGPTATKLFLDGKPQEVIDRLSKLAPLERLGRPRISLTRWPSSRARTAPGSTARRCAPMAGSSDPARISQPRMPQPPITPLKETSPCPNPSSSSPAPRRASAS